jgi:hypothetical protein
MATTDTLTTATSDAEQRTCEACERVADADQFRAFEADEIDDCVCDECLAVQRDAADADECNRLAYYYR